MNRPPRHALLEQLIALGDPLRRLLVRRMSSADADDSLQETAAKLLEGRGDVDVASPRAYLATAARRIHIDRQRRQAREVSLEYSELSNVETAQGDPAMQLADEQMRRQLRLALEQLRGPARRALILRYFHQMSHREIGEVMGISPRTVEKHLASGLAACRRFLSARMRAGD